MASNPETILDTHIHLWPSTATTSSQHAWMTPGSLLAKRCGISDYRNAISKAGKDADTGFIYVETDRYLPSSPPNVHHTEDQEKLYKEIKLWASEKLEEIAYLNRILNGDPQSGDGFEESHGHAMKGMIIWAPFNLQPVLFQTFHAQAKLIFNPIMHWTKVVGYRYLLQGRPWQEIKREVEEGGYFVENLRFVGQDSPAFDIGVDCHRNGVEVLGVMHELIEKVRETENGRSMTWILNHLCKPHIDASWPSFLEWASHLKALSLIPNVYMKLSGALNEFAPAPTPSNPSDLLPALRPYLDVITSTFGPTRIMFGSDWPVCNIGVPLQDDGGGGSWGLWRDVVALWMEEVGFDREAKEHVWRIAGEKAYRLLI